MTCNFVSSLLWITLLCGTAVKCIPKFEPGGGFVPSSGDFADRAQRNEDNSAYSESRNQDVSTPFERSHADDNESTATREQEPRFGFTSLGTTGTGYGGVSGYAPAKIDLGGVLLGAIIGVGTILVIPKLLYVFSGSYGAYARSEEGGIAQSMARLDDALARYGIDTTSCMQRAVCVYSKQAAAAMNNDPEAPDNEVSSIDRVIDAVTTNQVFETAMQGTAVQEAIQAGRGGRDCRRIYPQCGLSLEILLGLFNSMLTTSPSVGSRHQHQRENISTDSTDNMH